ncbi:hypothetical protein ACHAWF_011565 [Thalassiosira exigua]
MTSNAQVDGDIKCWLDRIVTPLNACSLETGTPISARNDGPTQTDEASRDVLPLVIGCYQLNEATCRVTATEGSVTPHETKDDERADASKTTRSGELRLYMIPTPPNGGGPSDHMSFGDAACVVPMDSGVLDGKWVNLRQDTNGSGFGDLPLFASACASGRIHLHSLERTNSQSWSLSHVASSDEPSSAQGTPICLSLAWNERMNHGLGSDKIVSSYSDGTVALHQFSCVQSVGGCDKRIEETHRWKAHTMFGCPSEVWACSFLGESENVILSGADDCYLKSWDIRQTYRPTHRIGSTEFEAGVTVLSPHPTLNHVFAVGSYDEYVRIYDHRKLDEPLMKACVGGGVWRIKWHPSCHNDETHGSGKMLVAAMHGGCCVLNAPTLSAQWDGEVGPIEKVSKFTAHESMAYGADWLWFNKSNSTVAASCSFYDRQIFMWDTS